MVGLLSILLDFFYFLVGSFVLDMYLLHFINTVRSSCFDNSKSFIPGQKIYASFSLDFAADDNGFFSKMTNDSDEEVPNEEDEEEADTNWRKIRHEREMFISQQEVLVFDVPHFFLHFF